MKKFLKKITKIDIITVSFYLVKTTDIMKLIKKYFITLTAIVLCFFSGLYTYITTPLMVGGIKKVIFSR